MQDTDKESYKKRYEELKKKGEEFFPFAIIKDVTFSLVVLLALIFMVVRFGVPLEGPANPTNVLYIPRPDWYFMFLFEMLRYFPGALEPFAVLGIPALGILILLAWPFLDRRPQRHVLYRPVSLALVTVSMFAFLGLTVRAYMTTPPTVVQAPTERLSPLEQAGKVIYQQQNCAVCHAINGVGGTVGPDLAGVGKRMEAGTIHSYIEEPRAINPDAVMPSYLPTLTHQEVEQLTLYLLTLE